MSAAMNQKIQKDFDRIALLEQPMWHHNSHLNWIFHAFKNRNNKPTIEARTAWKEHLRTDKYLTRSQVQYIYKNSLTGANVKVHLFWRYSIVWGKL
ncbi:hypothetical protein H6G17_00715 [Chroococcidiopsis sp. FACHB-1243]|uniref:hypothetical protein n=1 Tax=Chroococcidiopsis sp. [FACHB-1243] TaxID=2692781 RepID=UPI00177B19B7|nr:hypothetical protein [Chroococcidiopsis sp. [FACHB-1243]]MBD2304043.1 hypothetical protein [Chroococcidiopsis sp. [FACHB-1243]]